MADSGGPTPPATYDYAMPSLGADMDEGRVIEWRVAVGDTVHRGDLMAVVETEKSDIDIEIWHDGIVEEFLVGIGELVDVGTPIARLRVPEGAEPPAPSVVTPAAPSAPPAPAAPAAAPAPRAPAPGFVIRSPESTGRVPASPLARRLAAERGLSLDEVRGSGPGGAVIEADILAASATEPGTSPGRRRAARSADTMRAFIAERMARANREIPHYHLARELDTSALESWLAARNAERPIAERVLPAACYLRAVALTAARHRELNGFWVEDHFEPRVGVNVAMAISLRGGGLVTPRIEAADERSLDEVMAALTEFVAAARTGKLRASWMTDATITVTNLGDTGADLVHGVISPPQVALVGFGRSRWRPWVDGEAVVARPTVTATLAADHRATDGAVGSRFLATLAGLLDNPEAL